MTKVKQKSMQHVKRLYKHIDIPTRYNHTNLYQGKKLKTIKDYISTCTNHNGM